MKYYIIKSGDTTVSLMKCEKNHGSSTEITEAEYNSLLAEIRTKAEFVGRLYAGEITADDVPTEWRDEIVRRVNERRATEAEMQDDEISPDELMSMMEGIL